LTGLNYVDTEYKNMFVMVSFGDDSGSIIEKRVYTPFHTECKRRFVKK